MNIITVGVNTPNMQSIDFPEWARAYVEEWTKRLNLDNWEVHIKTDPREEGDGVAWADPRYKVVTIGINYGLIVNGNNYHFRCIILHELLEIVFANMVYTIRDRVLGDFIGDEKVRDHLQELFTHEKEIIIQYISRILAEQK